MAAALRSANWLLRFFRTIESSLDGRFLTGSFFIFSSCDGVNPHEAVSFVFSFSEEGLSVLDSILITSFPFMAVSVAPLEASCDAFDVVVRGSRGEG